MAVMNDVKPSESGLASGLVNTAFMMGGALGLAILASIAANHTDALTAAGMDHRIALNGGYHMAFVVGGIFAVAAAVIGALFMREGTRTETAPAH